MEKWVRIEIIDGEQVLVQKNTNDGEPCISVVISHKGLYCSMNVSFDNYDDVDAVFETINVEESVKAIKKSLKGLQAN